MDKIDALIAVFSGTPEFVEVSPGPPTPNLAGPFTESVDSTLLHPPHDPAVTTPLKQGHCLYKEPWTGRAVSHFILDLDPSTS